MGNSIHRVGKLAGLALLAAGAWAAEPAGTAGVPRAPQATITSDELELVDQGAESIFVGHVVLKQDPYTLWADRMHQVKATGIVDASGHVKGLSLKPTGEKVIATGRYARYDPRTEVAELWNHAEMTRWETQADTMPVHVSANRFLSHEKEHRAWAKEQVFIHRADNFWARCDEAQLDEPEQVVSLWGPHPTEMQWKDARGSAHFFSDRAIIFASPQRIRFLDHVKGHIVPAP